MSIVELSSELKAFVDESRSRIERILADPVRRYVESNTAHHEWFAAMMHNTGSGADEAIHLTNLGKEADRAALAKDVVRRLSGGIVSTTLMPALLPASLIAATNQAILASLRDAADGEVDGD